MSYHYTSLRGAEIKLAIPTGDEDVERLKLSTFMIGMQNGKTTWQFLKKLNMYNDMTQSFLSRHLPKEK